jgi:hypothetical protein
MNCVLQDDVMKFISESSSPPEPEEVPVEGTGKVREHHEVDEGDDTITT